jgi:Tfp pilus assembly protein PilN
MKIINLLPKEEQILLKQERAYTTVRHAAIYVVISYILVCVGLFGARLYMQQSLGNLDNEIKQQQAIVSKQDNAALNASIVLDNASIQDYNSVSALNPNWSKVLEEFVKLVPSGVSVQTFNASTDSGQIEILGAAQTRQAVLDLRSNILNDPMFENIDLPLDNLQQPTNLSYHYTFFVNTKLLQADPTTKLKLPPPPPPPSSAASNE